MKSANLEGADNSVKDVPLSDEGAHILIEYDQSEISLHCLTETIEMAGVKILEIITLREEPEGKKSILIKLGTREVRNVILNLSKHPLIRVKGYNSKPSFSEKAMEPRKKL